jgi:hypothetical protein
MKIMMIDPPEGWRYGFPKIDDWDVSKESRVEWWIRKGYPIQLIDKGYTKWCRVWEQEIDG